MHVLHMSNVSLSADMVGWSMITEIMYRIGFHLSAAWALLIGWQQQTSLFTTLDHKRADNIQVLQHQLFTCQDWAGKCRNARCPSWPFFLSRYPEIFFIYQPKKPGSESSVDPWCTEILQASEGIVHSHVFQLPTNIVLALSRLQPLLMKGQGLRQWREGAPSLRALPPLFPPLHWEEVMLWHTWPSWAGLRAPIPSPLPSGQTRSRCTPLLGLPQHSLKSTAMATHNELSPAWSAKKLEVGRASGHAWAPGTAEQTLLPPSQLCPGQRKPWHYSQLSCSPCQMFLSKLPAETWF